MKRIQTQLKTISRSLVSLSKQVERITKQVDKLQPAKKAPAKRKAAPFAHYWSQVESTGQGENGSRHSLRCD